MNGTCYRLCCGTHLGLVAHQAAGEQPCGECVHGELLRRVSVEAWPIALWPAAALPITRQQAEQNLAALMEAMAEHTSDEVEPGDPGPPDRTVKEEA